MSDQLKYSIYHLYIINNIIYNSIKALNDLARSNIEEINAHSGAQITASVLAYCHIKICAFIDEHRVFNGLYRTKSEFKKTIQQLVNEINSRWPGLFSFRNQILAHNFRLKDKSEESVFMGNGYSGYDVPVDVAEMAVLLAIANHIIQLFEKEFPELFEEFENGAFPPRADLESED